MCTEYDHLIWSYAMPWDVSTILHWRHMVHIHFVLLLLFFCWILPFQIVIQTIIIYNSPTKTIFSLTECWQFSNVIKYKKWCDLCSIHSLLLFTTMIFISMLYDSLSKRLLILQNICDFNSDFCWKWTKNHWFCSHSIVFMCICQI